MVRRDACACVLHLTLSDAKCNIRERIGCLFKGKTCSGSDDDKLSLSLSLCPEGRSAVEEESETLVCVRSEERVREGV